MHTQQTNGQMQGAATSGHAPPSQGWGPMCYLAGPSTRNVPSSHGVGTQSPFCALAEYGTASGLVHPQPKPGSRFIVLLEPGWGAK